MTLRIKDWEKYQHYGRRRPPWIKLYRTLLDDPDWFALNGDDAKLLVMLWLIASEDGGKLPASTTLAFRLRMPVSAIETSILKLSHWVIDDASTTLAQRLHDATPETERETERETESELRSNVVPIEKEKEQPRKEVFFESGVIRLSKKDFDGWVEAFSSLDLKAELTAIGPSEWATNLGSKWFVPVSNLLARRNREQAVRLAHGAGRKSDFHDPQAGII